MCGVADSSLGGSNEEAKDNARQQTDHRQKGGIGFFHGKASLPESFYFQYGKSRLICPLPGKIKTRWPKQAAGFECFLIVFSTDLEVSLGMSTNGANFGSFFADDNMAAVGALPNGVPVF